MSIFLLSLTVLMLLVIYLDLTSFTIPNWLNFTLLLLYIPLVLTSPEAIDWKMALLGAGIVFAIGFIVFSMKWMGGGDIKLFIALAPWVGWHQLLDYIILVMLYGGLLAVIIWLARKSLFWLISSEKEEKLPRILRDDEPVPYGLAIAGVFLYYLWSGDVPGVAGQYI